MGTGTESAVLLLARDLRTTDLGAVVSLLRWRAESPVAAGRLDRVTVTDDGVMVTIQGRRHMVNPDEVFRLHDSAARVLSEGRHAEMDAALDVAAANRALQNLARTAHA